MAPPTASTASADQLEQADSNPESSKAPKKSTASVGTQTHKSNKPPVTKLTIVGRDSYVTTTRRQHCHQYQSQVEVDKVARRKLIVACSLCVIFMLTEIIGGILSKSLAIATDAAHLLTDLAGFLISLFAIYLSGRPSSQRLNFGWHRAEVIGALISIYLIWLITGILIWLAVERLINNQHEVEAGIMLITSVLGIIFNIIMAVQLTHGHSHGHSHGGAHRNPVRNWQSTHVKRNMRVSKTNVVMSNGNVMIYRAISAQGSQVVRDNINVRAAIVHVIGDIVQSVGICVAAIIIFYKPEWAFVDSVCTFVFSIIVLLTTIRILRDVMMVLMEATPDYMDYGEVQRTFLSIDGVEHVHNLRIWALSIDKIALSAHLAISKNADPHLILEEATRLIHKRYNFFETTIQIEEYSPGMEDCNQCEKPVNPPDGDEKNKHKDKTTPGNNRGTGQGM